MTGILGVLFWVAVLLVIPGVRAFAIRNGTWVLLGAALVVTGIACAQLRRASASTRTGVLTFLAVTVATVALILLTKIPSHYQFMVLRGIFLFVMVVTPGALYVLFLLTRRRGILNEYFLNLDRLGLLSRRDLTPLSDNGPGDLEDDQSRKLRIGTYLQKFQAVFGPLSEQLQEQLLKERDVRTPLISPEWAARAASSASAITNTGVAVPLVLSTMLTALGWFLVLPPWQVPSSNDLAVIWKSVLIPVTEPALYAFLGAYFFSVSMLFRRYVRRDLRASAYASFALRVAISVISVWIVGELMPPGTIGGLPRENAMCVLGFIIGVFPPAMWQIMRSFLNAVHVRLPDFETALPIGDLDGLNIWHRTRLEEEDIENVPSMATADIVDLLLQTRYPADRVITWMDQAILYTHVGPEPDETPAAPSTRTLLRRHGIYTATSLIYEHVHAAKRGDQAAFEAILPAGGRSTIRSLVDALITNPNLDLIRQWRGLPAGEFAGWARPPMAASVPAAPPLRMTATGGTP